MSELKILVKRLRLIMLMLHIVSYKIMTPKEAGRLQRVAEQHRGIKRR